MNLHLFDREHAVKPVCRQVIASRSRSSEVYHLLFLNVLVALMLLNTRLDSSGANRLATSVPSSRNSFSTNLESPSYLRLASIHLILPLGTLPSLSSSLLGPSRDASFNSYFFSGSHLNQSQNDFGYTVVKSSPRTLQMRSCPGRLETQADDSTRANPIAPTVSEHWQHHPSATRQIQYMWAFSLSHGPFP